MMQEHTATGTAIIDVPSATINDDHDDTRPTKDNAPAEEIDVNSNNKIIIDAKDDDDRTGTPIKNGMSFQYLPLSNFLASNLVAQSMYGAIAGFFLYFSMYALRKPFKAGTFEDENGESLEWFATGMSLKTAIILFQLVGYIASKWIAIKVVSEAKGRQDKILTVIIILAELALVAFGLLQTLPNWTPIAMFFNGLMLGMVWGLVVLYFEGRRGSDLMLVVLSISFIVSSGIVKDVALVTMQDWGVNEFWMPATVGALFLPLYLFCTLMLNQLPPPSQEEVSHRAERIVMTSKSRREYFMKFWPGLTCLWIGVCFLTAYRDYRDSFAVEIFQDMGYTVVPGILSSTESIVAGVLLIPVAALVFIRSNVFAFKLSMTCLFLAAVMLAIVVHTFVLGSNIDGYNYYVLVGVASYLAYVPYNSVLYERLIAVLREPCNIAYLMAVMDALGYVGVFILFIVAEYLPQFDNHLDVFNSIGQFFGYSMIVVYGLAAIYFFVVKRDLLASSQSEEKNLLESNVNDNDDEDDIVTIGNDNELEPEDLEK